MNRVIMTGNVVRDPESGTSTNGVPYTRFTLAVRKRYHADGEQDADFVRVTAWRGLAESCKQYLTKGRKVAVIGTPSVSVWTGKDGSPRGGLEVTADEVEFLSARKDGETTPTEPPAEPYADVTGDEDLPF